MDAASALQAALLMLGRLYSNHAQEPRGINWLILPAASHSSEALLNQLCIANQNSCVCVQPAGLTAPPCPWLSEGLQCLV